MTRLRMVLKIAWRSLRQHKLRSLLTMLGIVIGVTAVLMMIGVGSGARAQVQEQVQSLGSNFLIVLPGSTTRGGLGGGTGTEMTLTVDDAHAVLKECPAVESASPGVRTVTRIIYGNANWSTYVTGTAPDYIIVRNWPVARGENFTEADVKTAAKVALMGETAAHELFAGAEPVGETIRIKDIPFRVIGVLTPKGQTAWGQDQDDIVVIPYTSAMKRVMNVDRIGVILVSAKTQDQVEEAREQMQALLRQRHHLAAEADDDFTIRSQAEIAVMFETTSKIMSLLLGIVASISLLVGGIGIMNIMLVSVTERTREIGIRMAVGATTRDILMQFLSESVVLSSMGGIVGILLGLGGSWLIRSLVGWPVNISLQAVVVAWGFAGAIGVGFGLYPARKAAKLDPIAALRYE